MRLQTSLGTRDPLTTHSRQLSPSSSLNLLPGCLYGFNDPGSIWFFIFINRVVQYDLHFWEYHLFARVKLCRSATHTHTHAHTRTHGHTCTHRAGISQVQTVCLPGPPHSFRHSPVCSCQLPAPPSRAGHHSEIRAVRPCCVVSAVRKKEKVCFPRKETGVC